MRLSFLCSFIFILFNCCGSKKKNNKIVESPAYNMGIEADGALLSGNYDKAVLLYNQLIQNDSINGENYYGKASANAHMGKIKEAIGDYLTAAKLGYMVAASYYNAGLLNIHINDSLAADCFKKALEANKDPDTKLTNATIQIEYDECMERLEK